MKDKVYICVCGNTVDLNIKDAARISAIPESYYEWICHECGQVIRRKVKDPIYVD